MHDVCEEAVGIVLDAVRRLCAAAGGTERPERHGAAAGALRVAFQHQHIGAGIARGERGGQAAGAATDDHHVDFGFRFTDVHGEVVSGVVDVAGRISMSSPSGPRSRVPAGALRVSPGRP